ncbi:MAG TPA: hypothetical protein PKN95_09455 [Verrucomicrobiota bacterium]|nr:hypothetical protein [Verrucomicrobiota bacterium]HNT15875.1 hypothetical protein [Verrucomicrobiota bacterium]
MKTLSILRPPGLLAGLAVLLPSASLPAQGTAFTYQGRLHDGASPASGIYDLRFTIYDSSGGPTVIAGPMTNSPVAVSNGLFTVTLDPGAGVFTGSPRWLEIAARTNGGGAFTPLTPRQAITPTPYARFAAQVNAAGVVGTLPPSSLLGGYPGSVQFTDPGNQFHGTFHGDGANLTGVDALALNGLSADQFWQTGGNFGMIPGSYLGTADPTPLELRVNNERALLIEPSVPPGGAPNWIGGHAGNGASGQGNVIGGGGESIAPNQATGDFGVINGGSGNTVGPRSVIGGGTGHFAVGQGSTIGGGEFSIAQGDHSTVGGGQFNGVTGELGTIAGGGYNQITGYAAVVGGGGGLDPSLGDTYGNQALGDWSVVGGGRVNLATNAFATASGGGYNHAGGYAATIAGGGGVDPNLGTLLTNRASGDWSVVSGGRENAALGQSATVGGGEQNTALRNWATASGGNGNQALGESATVGGGFFNTADFPAATVSGGAENAALNQHATVGGGVGNYAHGQAATIGGGANNQNDGDYATVPGGREAKPSQYGQLAHAAGMFANPGDAQHSIFILRAVTDAIKPTTKMALDGGVTLLAIEPNRTLAFDILLVGRADPSVLPGTDSFGIRYTGVVKDMNGTATFVGSPTTTTLGADPVPWSASLGLAGNALTINVSGTTSSSGLSTTVRWVARMDTADVGW